MPRFSGPALGIWEYQTPATLLQVAPVQDQWYDILPETANVRVYRIAVNVEDVNETLEVQILIDGETMGASALAATHSTAYHAVLLPEPVSRTDLIFLHTTITDLAAFVIEGRSVQVQVRKTTAAGAGDLTGIVVYGVKRFI